MIGEKAKFSEKDIRIAGFAKALSHPARVYIMRELSSLNGCCTSGEFFENLPIARSTLSQHLKELKLAGLIKGQIDPPYIKYCVHDENWTLAKNYFRELLLN